MRKSYIFPIITILDIKPVLTLLTSPAGGGDDSNMGIQDHGHDQGDARGPKRTPVF